MIKTYENPMGRDDSNSGLSPLTRSYTRSSKHELLKQIRDAVNPNQKLHNIIMMVQAGMITAAVIMLCVFAILANYEITQLIKASEDEIIPNLNDIIDSLGSIEKGVNTSYEMTTYMPLLYEMNDLSKGIEGNLSITVNAMISSPLFLSG